MMSTPPQILNRSSTVAESSAAGAEWPVLPIEYHEARWYAAYTIANHEKRVAEQFATSAVSCFLPLYSCVRRWKDRRVTLQLPLFPGYVFVHVALRDRLRVLQTPGVARLVEFSGKPAALPEYEVEALMRGLRSGLRVEPHPYLAVGQRVRIKQGPLAGLEGIIRRLKGNWRVILSLDLIQRSVSVDLDAANLDTTRISSVTGKNG